jgi:hypothetical protein
MKQSLLFLAGGLNRQPLGRKPSALPLDHNFTQSKQKCFQSDGKLQSFEVFIQDKKTYFAMHEQKCA